MAVYFISPTGSDSNPGSQISPWRTFVKTSVLVAGDVLYARGGNYGNDAICGPGMSRYPGRILGAGTSWANPITIAAYGSEVPIIRSFGTSSATTRYVIVVGFQMIADNDTAVYVHLGHHIRIQNCSLTNNYGEGQGIHFAHVGADYNEILNCRIFRCGKRTVHDPPPQIHGGYIASRYNLFLNCDFYENWGYGLQVYNGYSGERSDGNRILSCRAWRNGVGGNAAAFALANGSDCEISNCIAWDNPRGIDVAWQSPVNAKVYHNTLYRNGAGITIEGSSSGAIIKNNLLWRSGTIVNNGSGTIGLSPQTNLIGIDPRFVNAP